ncbi:MAG: ribonuclease P protein component [Prevotella sp.]|nr:ribonuclease P protein component [Prevotella sp.]MDY5257606.1 ribonuclease P protein component [Prevotella sp.]
MTSAAEAYTLGKEERICSKKLIEKLFKGGRSKSMVAYPLRVVYAQKADDKGENVPAQMLVSVSKRHFKHAVDRNRVKRQVREAYRKHKHTVTQALEAKGGRHLMMAFVWQDNALHDTAEVERKVQNLLTRIAERL